MRSETPIEVRRRVLSTHRRAGFDPHQQSIAALRRGARYFSERVRISVFKKRDPLERIYWQKWTALETAADYLACLKK